MYINEKYICAQNISENRCGIECIIYLYTCDVNISISMKRWALNHIQIISTFEYLNIYVIIMCRCWASSYHFCHVMYILLFDHHYSFPIFAYEFEYLYKHIYIALYNWIMTKHVTMWLNLHGDCRATTIYINNSLSHPVRFLAPWHDHPLKIKAHISTDYNNDTWYIIENVLQLKHSHVCCACVQGTCLKLP